MAPYRTVRRHSVSSGRSLGAFLLIASFGILFAGCVPSEPEDIFDDFTFTAEDVARFRELANQEEDRLNTEQMVPHLIGSGSNASEIPVLDLSVRQTFDSIRSGPGAVGEDVYRVTNTFLNVRSSPNVTASQVERLKRGDILTVLEFIDAAWAKVQLPNTREGYVAQRYIARLTSEDRLTEEKSEFEGLYFVDFGFLNVRKDPDAQSEKLGELSGQAFVRPLSMDEVWARIPFGEGEGYVARQYLSPFLPNFLVRQNSFTLPILRYRMVDEGLLGTLAQHVDSLRQAGIRLITLKDFYELLLQQEERDVRLDPHVAVLAIDDISIDTLQDALDVLRASNVKATFFIHTKDIGITGITEKKILTMLANGHDLQAGAHIGDDLRSLTNAQIDLELKQSRQLLEQYTNRDIFAVGYPLGGVNDRVSQKAADAGYLLGIGAAPDREFDRSDFLRMPSFTITPGMSGEDIVGIIGGRE
jgi:peptidoglycan/xylan/chitin deacetylase (PgdA/CDA1 family)